MQQIDPSKASDKRNNILRLTQIVLFNCSVCKAASFTLDSSCQVSRSMLFRLSLALLGSICCIIIVTFHRRIALVIVNKYTLTVFGHFR